MNKPLVSVIMPVYNGEKYIRKAVESVYEQGVSLELLVIDDGSTDHTEEVLSAYEGREDFRYIKNEQNMGAAGSRNRGVGLAQGTYIAFLDADDWWEPGKHLSSVADCRRYAGTSLERGLKLSIKARHGSQGIPEAAS